MTKERIITIGLGSLAAIFLVGWVIPDYPYTRRISVKKAEELKDEYKKLYFKNYLSVKDNSLPKLTKQESDKMLDIMKKLMTAGYRLDISVDDATKDIMSSLVYPKYAQ